jgi:hypothetical protein
MSMLTIGGDTAAMLAALNKSQATIEFNLYGAGWQTKNDGHRSRTRGCWAYPQAPRAGERSAMPKQPAGKRHGRGSL